MYKSVSLNDPDFAKKLTRRFKADGLAVITDVFTKAQCDKFMGKIIDDFVELGTGIDIDNIEETWIAENLPPQTRAGLFQALMSNLQSVWDIRSNPNIRTIFETLYGNLKGKKQKEFIVSGDGINIRPGFIGPYVKPNTKDWPHLDQTILGNMYKCIQGQAVLTNTSASFVASPKSHLIFDKLLKKLKIDNKTNWLKFTPEQVIIAKKLVKEIGGKWQIPILAPAGSFIVWASTTIHSAKLQDKCEMPKTKDKYYSWRGIVYVCYRPQSEFSKSQLAKRVTVYKTNRTTNHWGTKMFSKRPGGRYLYVNKYHAKIEKLLDNPELISPIKLNNNQKRLLGLKIYK